MWVYACTPKHVCECMVARERTTLSHTGGSFVAGPASVLGYGSNVPNTVPPLFVVFVGFVGRNGTAIFLGGALAFTGGSSSETKR